MEDRYQERYLAHQKRKKEVLIQIMRDRHSNRMFSDQEVPREVIDELVSVKSLAPSSCDRQAVKVDAITDRDKKELLSCMLVGAVGWLHRAPVILLISADPAAYKAGNEVQFNSYLDMGCVVQSLYLAATAMGLHCAYANPAIRDMNVSHYESIFGTHVRGGALAIGWPHPDNLSKEHAN